MDCQCAAGEAAPLIDGDQMKSIQVPQPPAQGGQAELPEEGWVLAPAQLADPQVFDRRLRGPADPQQPAEQLEG